MPTHPSPRNSTKKSGVGKPSKHKSHPGDQPPGRLFGYAVIGCESSPPSPIKSMSYHQPTPYSDIFSPDKSLIRLVVFRSSRKHPMLDAAKNRKHLFFPIRAHQGVDRRMSAQGNDSRRQPFRRTGLVTENLLVLGPHLFGFCSENVEESQIRKSFCKLAQWVRSFSLCSSFIGSSFNFSGHKLRAFSRASSRCGFIARHGTPARLAHASKFS